MMGVGDPLDILNSIKCGIDLFDCVLLLVTQEMDIFSWNGKIPIEFEYGR
jgi:tRNA-guanine family transglycosylase